MAGPEVRPPDALGPLRAARDRRVVGPRVGGPAVPGPRRDAVHRVQGDVLRADSRVQSAAVRPDSLGRGGAGRGDAVRGVHDQASRWLQHVGHPADGLPDHRPREPVPGPPAGERRERGVRRLSGPGLHDRGLLLQARLAPPRLLVSPVGDSQSQQQLRHPEVPREVAELPGLHVPPDRGADDHARARGHPVAGRRLGEARLDDQRRGPLVGLRHRARGSRTSTCRASRPWPEATSRAC